MSLIVCIVLGCRKWNWFRNCAVDPLTGLEALFGSISVTSLHTSLPDPTQRYIFGYHPHGLFPAAAGFLHLTKDFREKWPGVEPVGLTASAMFIAPVIRDVMSWLGFRDVSHQSFVRALEEVSAVLICPGGQEELVEAYRCAPLQVKF